VVAEDIHIDTHLRAPINGAQEHDMRPKAKQLGFQCLFICFVIGALPANDVAAGQAAPAAQGAAAALPRPPFIVTDMYTGADGLTYLRTKEVKNGELEKAAAVVIGRLSANPPRPSDWHNAPWRRYVISLSGRFEVEISAGGVIKSFGPGDVLLTQDVTGKGHKTRAVGGVDCVWMFVELDQPRPQTAAGRGAVRD
jgi:hypothetical protein